MNKSLFLYCGNLRNHFCKNTKLSLAIWITEKVSFRNQKQSVKVNFSQPNGENRKENKNIMHGASAEIKERFLTSKPSKEQKKKVFVYKKKKKRDRKKGREEG